MWKAKKISICFSLILFLLHSVAVASKDIREVSAEEKQKIFERLKELQKDIHSMHATVNQEKQLSVLKKKIQVKGTIIMAKPNMLRWDVTMPEKSITVIDGETMTVYHPTAKEAQVYNLSEDFVARNTMSFFATAMGGNLNEMEKKFTVTVFRNDGKIVFKLIPLSSIARKYLSDIAVYYDEVTGLPGGFEVTTPKGDRTITKLADIKINPEIKPDTFELKLPGDVWITNKIENTNN
jgi:outer membrane lipoprotein-sorting protein